MFRFFVTRVSTCVSRAGRLAAAAVLTAAAVACSSSGPTAPDSSTNGASASMAQDSTVRSSTTVNGITAIQVPGTAGTNYTCRELAALYAPGAEWFEVKFDQKPSGAHQAGDDMMTASISNGTAIDFNWSSDRSVDAVFVKSGTNGHNLYVYNAESTGDSGLTTPSGQDISHVSFCYDVELEVSKTVSTSFERDFDWTVVKSVDQPSVTLENGGQAVVNYSVAAMKDNGTDSGWTVSGTITVKNPHKSLTASNVSVVETLTEHGVASAACPNDSLAPLASMTCTYGAVALASGASRTGTSSADSAVYGIVKGEGVAAVTFVTPTTVFDNAVDVTDSYAPVATLANGLTASRTFNYARTITASELACGANTIGNTASVATDDRITRTAAANVTATLTCDGVTSPALPPPSPAVGCSYSQGYWGAHSSRGPAPYNSTWAALGEDIPFYLSGQTYYSQMHVSSKGNAYNVLAVQFIAATLNVLSGAAAPAGVDMTAVDTFFKTYTPAQAGAMKGSDPVRKQALEWAQTLDSFNNGMLNVPKCG